jgi:hypothetical protein
LAKFEYIPATLPDVWIGVNTLFIMKFLKYFKKTNAVGRNSGSAAHCAAWGEVQSFGGIR